MREPIRECEQWMGGGKTRHPVRKCSEKACVRFTWHDGQVQWFCKPHASVNKAEDSYQRSVRAADHKKSLIDRFSLLSVKEMETLLGQL